MWKSLGPLTAPKFSDSHEIWSWSHLNHRSKDIIDYCFAHESAKREGELPAGLVVNISQDLCRKAWCYGCPTICRSSELFAFDYQRVLHPAEHLAIMGFRLEALDLTSLSHKELKDLTGDGMSMGCVVAVITVVLNSLWQHSESPPLTPV